MKPKVTTAMLLICAVVLGAFIWFVEREEENTVERIVRGRTVFEAYPESIFKLELERGDVRIVCSKASGKWRLTYPADAPLDPAIVEQMIAGMASVQRGELISQETLLERGLTPADYGFEEPQATIRFSNNHGSFTWKIGRNAPIGETLYVMSDRSGDIISAPQTLLHLVPEDPAWIRDRTLFDDNAAAIRGIDLQTQSGFLQLRKKEAGDWELIQPFAGPADALRANELIDAALSARIMRFVTDEQADLTVYGLSPAEVELTLFNRSEETQRLMIGATLPDSPELRYAKWVEGTSVFAVSSEWVDTLHMDRDLLRSRRIIDIPLDQIDRIEIGRGDQRIELIQTNQQWKVTRPVRQDVDPEPIHVLLASLSLGIANQFIDEPSEEQQALLETDAWTLQLSAEGNTQGLRILPEESGGWLVCRGDESALCRVEKIFFDERFIDPLYYRNLTVVQIEPKQVTKLVQRRLPGDEQTLDDPTDPLFQRITGALKHLKAIRYVSGDATSLSSYDLENPAFRLTVMLNGTNLLGRALSIGAQTEEGYFAMLQGENAVFVLPESIATILMEMRIESSESIDQETE